MQHRQQLLNQSVKLEQPQLQRRHLRQEVSPEVIRVHQPDEDAECNLVGHVEQ